MAEATFAWNALTCLYAGALAVGLLYALFLLFFQGVGHAFDLGGHFDLHLGHLDLGHVGHVDLGGHADAGHDGSEASGLSMLAISGFVTAFGAFGLGASYLLNAGAPVSLIAAVAGGLIVGGAGQLFFIHILSPTISQNISLSTLKGTPAEVTVPIPTDGLGQVAYVAQGQRLTLGARASDGSAIPRGAPVVIDSVRDGIAYVSQVGENSNS